MSRDSDVGTCSNAFISVRLHSCGIYVDVTLFFLFLVYLRVYSCSAFLCHLFVCFCMEMCVRVGISAFVPVRARVCIYVCVCVCVRL